MTKNLTHLTGIVLLITILIAGGCGPAKVPEPSRNMSVVIITVKAHMINDTMHLEMYDSNDPNNVVTDELETFVKDSTEIFWVLANDSGLKKIIKVSPKGEGKIMPKKATGIWFIKKYKKHKVPDNQTPGDIQEYYIKVKDIKNVKWEIDPYLRIPHTDDGADE